MLLDQSERAADTTVMMTEDDLTAAEHIKDKLNLCFLSAPAFISAQ